MARNNQYPIILGMKPPNKQGIGIKSKRVIISQHMDTQEGVIRGIALRKAYSRKEREQGESEHYGVERIFREGRGRCDGTKIIILRGI